MKTGLYRITEFALRTGCRRAEVLNLEWRFTDIKNQVCRVSGKGKMRTVYLLPQAVRVMGEPDNKRGYVFRHFNPSTVTHRFKKICKKCGIEYGHFHNLRHTAATRMIESGIPLEIVQKILGHSKIATTQLYAKISDNLVKRELKKYGEMT